MFRYTHRLLAVCALLAPLIAPVISTQAFATETSPSTLPTSEVAHKYMIVTANPLATAAGERILKRGGTAVDAMIAAQTVLGLVEPQSSGLGGGAFVVYYDAKNDDLTTFDARETAPASATEDRFLDAEGSTLGFLPAWQSGASVGVPGVPRLMEEMHARYGKKQWRWLFGSAIELAENGYSFTQRTSEQVDGLLAIGLNVGDKCENPLFFRDPAAFEYFIDTLITDGQSDCAAKPAGTLITNTDYANTLRRLAREGADAFYTGDIASAIVNAVNNDTNIPGGMSLSDLANYKVIERDPVCIEYRGYPVCGMGPPSSGALAVGQILGIMENFSVGFSDDPVLGDLSAPLNIDVVHLFSQAGRLAFADRGQFVADSDFVTVPVDGMLDKDYLAQRATLIQSMDMGSAEAGTPPGWFDPGAPDLATKNSGTSHLSIVDKFGNALSMTTTIESSFGNGVLVRGFLLNNELTDFSFNPGTDSDPVANRVEGGKRPRSSMSPTIVFDGKPRRPGNRDKKGNNHRRTQRGAVELVTGSPGGSRIIGYTAQSIMNHIDFGLDPQASINVPHYMNRNGRTDIEQPIPGVTLAYDAEALATALKERGHSDGGASNGAGEVGIITQTSGLSIINVSGRYLVGGADKRRDGTVGGR